VAARRGNGGVRPGARERKIGLALAGGGPLGGVYEIGALIALNEALEGFDFQDADVYVGVSAGALVASLLANGISPEEMARVFIQPRPGDPRFSPLLFMRPAYHEYLRRCLSIPGLFLKSTARYLRNPLRHGLLESYNGLTRAIPTAIFDNRPIERFLAELFGNRGYTNDFRELDRQLFVVAVDLDTGQAVRFGAPDTSHVGISRAVQASTALPGLYPPVRIGGRYFVDGGLKRTLHASVALNEGVDLLFCVNPIVPYDAELAAADAARRHAKLVEGGLPTVLAQTFRSLIHSRMQIGMKTYDTTFKDAKVVLFEPDRHDTEMFFSNVFSYANRENVCQHAYRTTRRDLRARRAELEPVLEAHGIGIRDKILAESGRQFTRALDSCQQDVRRLGLYGHRTANALSGALDRVERYIAGTPAEQARRR
jgi:predicted acylesterase/phospholipase RssA